jgi:Caspase domain
MLGFWVGRGIAMSILKVVAALLVCILAVGSDARAAPSERRIALVIGNANYQAGALPTPANDAGLIAQTPQAAGFDVTGARDLDQDTLRRTFREFLDKASSGGPETSRSSILAAMDCSWKARTISRRSTPKLPATST